MADGQPDPALRGRDLVGLGGMLAGAVVLGLVVGLLIDHVAGTSPVFTLLGIACGITTGAAAFWVKVRSVLK